LIIKLLQNKVMIEFGNQLSQNNRYLILIIKNYNHLYYYILN